MPRFAKKTTIDELRDIVLEKYEDDTRCANDYPEEEYDIYDPEIFDDFMCWLWQEALCNVPDDDLKGVGIHCVYAPEGDYGGGFKDWNVKAEYKQFGDYAVAILFCCNFPLDGEVPVAVVAYIDNKNKLRAYVPSEGNVYDFKNKCHVKGDSSTYYPDMNKIYKAIENRIKIKEGK